MEREYFPDEILRDPPDYPDEIPACEVCGTDMTYIGEGKWNCFNCNPYIMTREE